MPDIRRVRFNTEGVARGLTTSTGLVTTALKSNQLWELLRIIAAGNMECAISTAPADVFVLAPIASQTNTITVTGIRSGTALATDLVSVQIGDNASDALAVTWVAGVLFIKLANVTDSLNTLTLIKAAIDVAAAGAVTTQITGTASTQMVHGGTNTVAATAAGGAAAGGIKSSAAGQGTFSVTPV